MNLRLKPLAGAGGGLFALAFTGCFFWSYFVPADLLSLHMSLLKMGVLGFSGLNFLSFVLGFIQSYIWGILAVTVFWLCYYHCDKYIFKSKE